MGDEKCGVLILDAIDQLRKRKARPDLDRICHLLERKHGFKGASVNEELSRLVDAGKVIKVDYKGNTSYRNAAKWVKTKVQFFERSFYTTGDPLSVAVLEAVKSLTAPVNDQTVRSASISDIERYLLSRDSQSNLNVNTLTAILDKEVRRLALHKLQNGEYIPLKNAFEDSPSKKMKFEVDSVENMSSSSDESSTARCDYCLFTASANRKGQSEELLICKECAAKAHPSCMEYTKLLYEGYPEPQNWQCPDCKTCCICDETGESNDMCICFICFDGYHNGCHSPKLTEKPTGTWLCYKCDVSAEETKSFKYAKKEDPDCDIVLTPKMEVFHKSIEQYPSCVPAARKWSIDNVEAFFKFIGFEDEAQAFREQEIDGLSLLLMKRNDVLTGLGIKLGPALKIYKHVSTLQTKISECI